MNGSGLAPTVLHSLMVFVLSELGREAGAIELAKIGYLIDVEKARLIGQTMTGESYTRQVKGPLAKSFESCITDMDGFEISVTIRERGGASPYAKKAHALGDKLRFRPLLSTVDKVIARRVLARVKNLTPLAIERLAYDTEPMKAILAEEGRTGKQLLGEPIDFSLVQRNPIIQQWRENMKKPAEPDARFEAFLQEEGEQIDHVLASLE